MEGVVLESRIGYYTIQASVQLGDKSSYRDLGELKHSVVNISAILFLGAGLVYKPLAPHAGGCLP